MDSVEVYLLARSLAAELAVRGPSSEAAVCSALRSRGLRRDEAAAVLGFATENALVVTASGAFAAGAEPPAEGDAILVVEDDDELRRIARSVFAEEGHRVLSAHDGREALGVLEAVRPRAVLLDLVMPIMSGWQLLDAIRARPDLAGVPIVVLTGGGRLGVPDGVRVLEKPAPVEAILEALGLV